MKNAMPTLPQGTSSRVCVKKHGRMRVVEKVYDGIEAQEYTLFDLMCAEVGTLGLLAESDIAPKLIDFDGIKIVMTYIDGVSFVDLLYGEDIDRREILVLMRKVADALLVLRDKGLSHGDLHAGNIIICPDRTVKFIDFGNASDWSPEGEADDIATFMIDVQRFLPRVGSRTPRTIVEFVGRIEYELGSCT